MTTSELLAKYRVTQAQIDAADRYIESATQTVFYLIESQSTPGVHYKVFFNRQFNVLQCAAHDGPACPASEKGLPCYHKRIALAAEAEYREMRRAERQAAARIAEASRPAAEVAAESKIEALVRGGFDRETAIRVQRANERPTVYHKSELLADESYNHSPVFSLLK